MLIRTTILILLAGGSALGGGVYSYVDESGARVLTNLGMTRRPDIVETVEPAALDNNFSGLIRETSARFGVNEELVSAIIKVESAFNPRAVSPKNCKGLMQLHPDTASRFGVKDIFDPAQNIEGGVRFLTHLMSEFDRNLDHVLAAYNSGENAVRRHNGIPPYTETQDYVKKVKAEFGQELEPPPPVKRANRIYRFVDENGQVVLTNAPSGD